MKTFGEFISEKVSSFDLANRLSRRYGKKSSFGKWKKVEKGGHIPLSGYDGRKVNSADLKLSNVQAKLGMYSQDSKTREDATHKFWNEHHTHKAFKISELKPTQQYVRTDDKEKLQHKLADKNPSHIHVITHKGEHYIADGNHAVMAAKLRGEQAIIAKHIDLDKH